MHKNIIFPQYRKYKNEKSFFLSFLDNYNRHLQSNPGSLIVSAYPGEGDGDAVYYYIKFQKLNDQRLYQVEWQYLAKNGKMTLNHRGAVIEVK